MSYVAVPHQSTGYLVLASDWNQGVSDNPAALYAGAMSIASQAAGDVITAVSATQLGRVAAGTAGNVLKSDGTQWIAGPVPGAMSLLKSGTGTATGAAATVVDSVATGALGVKDALWVIVTMSGITSQNPTLAELYNVTDSLSIQGVAALPTTGANDKSDGFVLTNGPSAATRVLSRRGDNAVAPVTFTTAWTTGFTLGLRINPNAGSTPWSWDVVKITG